MTCTKFTEIPILKVGKYTKLNVFQIALILAKNADSMKFRVKLPFLILFDMAFGRMLIEFLVECLVEEHLSLHKFSIF